jgi:O-methyltransferase involved in polyketide biosynthesis
LRADLRALQHHQTYLHIHDTSRQTALPHAVVQQPTLKLAAAACRQEAVQRSGCDPAAPHHLLFAARARILDDMVMQELQQLAAQSKAPAEATTQQTNSANPTSSNAHSQGQQQQQQAELCLQVVSVGCGVDTRPWRLAFPPGVAWFDLDQQPVINLKGKLLAAAGAEQHHHHQQQQQQVKEQQQYKFPLKCSTYTALASDATSSSWLNDLTAAGFSRTLPTVWVAEGLLYYLTPQQGVQLFADIAVAGRPGACVVLATHIPKCNLEANKTAPANHSLAGEEIST